ncbi:MAG: LamG domain-containing protein [Candidatus Nanoarchaeia archaeon]
MKQKNKIIAVIGITLLVVLGIIGYMFFYWQDTEENGDDWFNETEEENETEAINPPTDYIAYWSFNEGSGSVAYDETGSFDGSISGATYTTSGCASGSCLRFDGLDDYVKIGNYDLLKPSTITVSAWFIREGGERWSSLVYNMQWPDSGYLLFTDAKPYVSWRVLDEESYNEYDLDYPIQLNQLYHVVGVYDGASSQLYINGELVDSTPASYNPDSPTKTMIGNNAATAAPFLGTIDDVKIYDRALSSDEISDLYNSI